MALIVQKFGGSSVKDAEHLRNVADIVTGTYKNGNDVVVVVSAQGDTTDDLIDKAKEINRNPSKREMDQLLTAGEQISASLLAMTIEDLGYPVVSLLGWQAGFSIKPENVIAGARHHDTYVRTLLAGVPAEKIVHMRDESDTPAAVSKEADTVFILYDVYTIRLANDIRDKMIEREKEGETK